MNIHPLFHTVENREMIPVFNELHTSSSKCSDCSSCHNRPILKILWKSINPFYHNVAHRHAAAPRWKTMKQSSQDNYFLCCAWHITKISCTSVHPFSMILRTNTDLENRKINPIFKGLVVRSQKCSTLFLISCPHFPKNFTKIRSSVFP